MRVLLIDGLNLVRRVYAGVPEAGHGGDHDADVAEAATRSLQRALLQVEPTHAVCVFDAPPPTWRHLLHPGYKANRPPMPERLAALLPRIEQAFAKPVVGCGVSSVRTEGFEADDVIASIALKLRAHAPESQVVVLSTDKGLLPLLAHGVRVRNHFEEKDMRADDVRKRFGVPPEALPLFLALVGDHSQGIPGVRSIGAKTAARLITSYDKLTTLLAAAPELPGNTGKALREGETDARLSLTLVSMREDVDAGVNLRKFRLGGPVQGPAPEG